MNMVLFILIVVVFMHMVNAEDKIKFVSVGLGTFGSRIAYLAITDYNMQCVGAITRSTNHGKDISSVIGLDTTTNVTISPSSELRSILLSEKPDIVFQATRSNMNDTFDQIKIAIQSNCNVITLAEELWYPWTTSPEKSKMLDKIAKANNVAIIGTGGQDIGANNVVYPLLNAVPSFNRIHLNYNFNFQHPYYWKYVPVGGINLTVDEAANWINSKDNILINQVIKIFIRPIIERTVVNILEYDYNPFDDVMTECKIRKSNEAIICLGCSDKYETQWILSSNSIGGECITKINTKQNVVVSGSMGWGLYDNFNGWNVDWTVSGPYNSETLILNNLDDLTITAIAAINRVHDAIQKNGLITNITKMNALWKNNQFKNIQNNKNYYKKDL